MTRTHETTDMRTILTRSLLSLSLLALGGCFFNDDSGPATASGPAEGASSFGDWDTTFTDPVMSLNDSQVVISVPQVIEAYCSKSSGTTVLKYDTAKAHQRTIQYRLDGDLLLFFGGTTDIPPSGKAMQYTLFKRISGPAGSVVGTWSNTFQDSLQPLDVPETDSVLIARRASEAARAKRLQDAGAAHQITIAQGSITLREKDGNWAKQDLMEWNDYDAGHFSVTVGIVDANTVTYSGKTETVTIKRLDRSRTQYFSTNSAHPAYIRQTNPGSIAQCPDEWLSEFLTANYLGSGSTLGRIASESPSASRASHWY